MSAIISTTVDSTEIAIHIGRIGFLLPYLPITIVLYKHDVFQFLLKRHFTKEIWLFVITSFSLKQIL